MSPPAERRLTEMCLRAINDPATPPDEVELARTILDLLAEVELFRYGAEPAVVLPFRG